MGTRDTALPMRSCGGSVQAELQNGGSQQSRTIAAPGPERTLSMSGLLARFLARLLVVGALVALAAQAFAHDSWISRGAHRNAAGEWCCGEGDCFVVPGNQVSVTPAGYRLVNGEIVPFNEAQPSRDGEYWRCKRSDGSRRCFFAPPQTD
jgi:hypothetical protein